MERTVQIKCFLCKSNINKDRELSFHKFPKNNELCKMWKEACGCLPEDNVTNLRICSKHFANKRVSFASWKVVTYLDHGAIPSIDVPNPPEITCAMQLAYRNSPLITSNSSEDIKSDSQVQLPVVNSINSPVSDSSNCQQKPIAGKGVAVKCVTSFTSDELNQDDQPLLEEFSQDEENINLQESFFNNQSNIAVNSTILLDHLIDNIDYEDQQLVDIHENNIDVIEVEAENINSAFKRRYYEPRFTSEIQYEDFIGCPKKAKRTIKMIIEQHHKKSKEIRQLKNRVNYHKKKLDSYKRIVNELKLKKLTEDSKPLHKSRDAKSSKRKKNTKNLSVEVEKASETKSSETNEHQQQNDTVVNLVDHSYSTQTVLKSRKNTKTEHPRTLRISNNNTKTLRCNKNSNLFTKQMMEEKQLEIQKLKRKVRCKNVKISNLLNLVKDLRRSNQLRSNRSKQNH